MHLPFPFPPLFLLLLLFYHRPLLQLVDILSKIGGLFETLVTNCFPDRDAPLIGFFFLGYLRLSSCSIATPRWLFWKFEGSRKVGRSCRFALILRWRGGFKLFSIFFLKLSVDFYRLIVDMLQKVIAGSLSDCLEIPSDSGGSLTIFKHWRMFFYHPAHMWRDGGGWIFFFFWNVEKIEITKQ